MADSYDFSLDELFERLEQMPVPEGYKVQIVEGAITMSPQRDVHWKIIRRIVRELEDRFGMDVNVLSDVRIDFGEQNGFAPDVVKLAAVAKKDSRGRWLPRDIEFVAEVISKGTSATDYGPKKLAYAAAGIPVYLIVDPYVGRCHVHSEPKDGDYHKQISVDFGLDVDLTGTAVDLTLRTGRFPRD
ncbi:Uma2 family endonuclease [Streptomyces sp. NPDC051644]|uniref:Uma2 family endonuclease n=1 Tax=Streptomyces sp. NPDC051644 TaxID=3365666 RepID=UPI0037A9AE2F